jgi:hypothetical protein
MTVPRTLRLSAILLAALLLVACSEGPDEVYQRALDARAAKDRVAYLACFTTRTQRLLERLDEVEALTRKKLSYLKDPFTLLPKGSTIASSQGKAKEKGNVARLRIKGGREDIEVVMLKEAGEWRIEALELEAFWGPMMRSAEVE